MKSKNILIVENKQQDKMLFEYLVGQIYTFESVSTGSEALFKLSADPPLLILYSLSITDIDTGSFMERVRKQVKNSCEVIAVLSSKEDSNSSYLHQLGFESVIHKPIRPKEFLLKIQSMVEKMIEKETQKSTGSKYPSILNSATFQQLLRLSSKEVIHQVYKDFEIECDAILQQIDASMEKMPNEEFLRRIHTIKGNSGTLGAEKIYEAAKNSETLGKDQKNIEFPNSLAYLKAVILEFQEYLQKDSIVYGA